jgi:MSHA pilin protein MshC
MRGFTLVELVVIIMILGILAVVVMPRLTDSSAFDARGFSDELAALVRFGQKVAIAQHRNVYVVTSGGAVSLCFDAACSQPVPNPAGGNFTKAAPSGVSLTGASLSFDALGKPSAPATFTVGATGFTSRTLTVEKETGYAHF